MTVAKMNRIKSRQSKPGLFWCDCDRNKVHAGQRCGVCKRRAGRRRNKRDYGVS